MEKYKLIILLTCHENEETVKDSIENILKFNNDVCVLINDGTQDGLKNLSKENVFIVNRQPLNEKDLEHNNELIFERYDTMIPLHIQLKDCMLENDLVSDYIVLLSSNQLFIRNGLYDFMKNYQGSYFNRDIDNGCISSLKNNKIFEKLYNDIGQENFKHQSNHDGMFFTYDIFMKMMDYFEDFRYIKLKDHAEEFLYGAYLFKNVHMDKLVEFSKYNYWQPSWRQFQNPIKIDELKQCLNGESFIIKRVSRDFNDEVRKYIRELK